MLEKRPRAQNNNHNGSTPALNPSQPNSIRNLILRSLSPKDRNCVMSKLEWVDLPPSTVLHEAGEDIEFGHFIESGLASILNVMASGKSVEVGLSGKEGFVGTPLLVGYSTSPSRVVMQVGGNGFRIKARDLAPILKKCPVLAQTLDRYSYELIMQARQIAVCNRLHEVGARLARWLLMSQDRMGGRDVPLTQQFLAHMLGTRRASVTVAASLLQENDLISYKRGHVTIVDRQGLERATCECYKKMIAQTRRWQKETGKRPAKKT